MKTEAPDGESTDRSATLAPTATTLKLGEHLSSDLDDSLLRRVAGTGGDAPALVAPELGSVIDGKYRLESLRGRGGMGYVFAARHLASDRTVALKWMQRRGDATELSKRFVGEARAAGRIRHPNVVDVYDVVVRDDLTYLVMELLEGESLRKRLRRGPLSHAEAVELGAGLLSGLEEAHRRGVIHRDLKPENVFLCSDPPGRVKIVDFGISVVERADAGLGSPLTRAGQFVGTPSYTALERLRDNQPFDHRVDLYSVGVILYEALSGNLPFSAMSVSELTFLLATSNATPLRTHLPGASPELQHVIHRALERNAADRFQDASAFREALVATTVAGSVRPARSRHRATAIIAAAVMAVALLISASARHPTVDRRRAIAATPSATVAAPLAPAPENTRSPSPPANAEPAPIIANVTSTPPTHPPTRRRRVAGPEPTTEPVGTAAQEIRDATLRVVIFPYGDVWVDGRRAGVSPATVWVAAGSHKVAGGRTAPERERSVDIRAGETREVVISWGAKESARPSEPEALSPPDVHAVERDGQLERAGVRVQ